MKILGWLLVLSVLMSSGPQLVAADPRPILNTLRDSSVADGCGLSLVPRDSSPQSDTYYLWSEDGGDHVVISVGGKDVTAKCVKSNRANHDNKVGSHYSETYVWKDVTIVADYEITTVCGKADENCEGTNLKAKLTARRGDQTQTLLVNGYSGC
jgi:hypothetical protein